MATSPCCAHARPSSCRARRYPTRCVNPTAGIAAVHDAAGRSAEAQALYARALAIDEATLGPDYPHVAQRLTNLANTYHQLGDDVQARALDERALAIQERSLGSATRDARGQLANNRTWPGG